MRAKPHVRAVQNPGSVADRCTVVRARLPSGRTGTARDSTDRRCEEPIPKRGERNDDAVVEGRPRLGAPTPIVSEVFQLTERTRTDTDRAEAVRDLWEAELELENRATTQTSEERHVATRMQEAPIPIINSPPERTWIWSDLHLADRSVLAAWNRPFRNIEEMNRHLLRE